MIEDVKQSLRITVNAFDLEIQDLIEEARLDLQQAGVSSVKANDDADPLVKGAIKVYCKAKFGYDNPDADRFLASYEGMKQSLRLSAEYGGYQVTFSITDGANPLEEALITFNGFEMYTDSIGQAVFKGVRPKQHIEYEVYMDGYVTASGYVNVSTDTTETVEMTVIS